MRRSYPEVFVFRAAIGTIYLLLGLAAAGASEAPRVEDRVLLLSADDGGPQWDSLEGARSLTATFGPDGEPHLSAEGGTANSEDDEAVIIELSAAPLLARPAIRASGGLRRGSGAAASARRQLELQHARASQALLQVVQRSRRRSVAASAVIRRKFLTAFNGFAVTLSEAEQQEVLRLPDVVAIHPDVDVFPDLDVSVPLVGAPTFWTDTSYRGAGMVIAMIDTGIDYTHADLGGCFGGACKVLDGYDFFNDDADPIDDNGHGTHVASTAAGTNPTLTGVAPDASLLAYKVLPASGSAPQSTIIAAVERAIDPNEDSDTSDRADVINMSLGGGGSAVDPLSQAVDNATAAGSLVVVAAGNKGPLGYFTLNGSPAEAATALTVAATDDLDTLAVFSSKGPTADFKVKPEIAAPGVGICAAQAAGTALGASCFDTTHISINGTSMATPHVAGAATLLRGEYPALTPLEVKSLLANNAADVSLGVMEAGGGRLDIPRSAVAQTVVDPVAVSFGLDDSSVSPFTASESLVVSNVSNVTGLGASLSYTISTTALPPGVQLVTTPSTFSLNAGESITIDVDLTVGAAVPTVDAAPHTYEGVLLVDSGIETQAVPFAVVKPSVLHIDVDAAPANVIVHDGSTTIASGSLFGAELALDLFIPQGTYEVVVAFNKPTEAIRPAIVVRENVVVAGRTALTVNSTEATNEITHPMEDATAAPILTPDERHLLVSHDTVGVLFRFDDLEGSPPLDGFAVNDIGAGYALDTLLVHKDAEDFYASFQGIDDGVTSSVVLAANASDYESLVSRFVPRAGEGPLNWISTVSWIVAEPRLLGQGLVTFHQTTSAQRNIFLTPVPRRPFPLSLEFEVVEDLSSTGAAPYTRVTATHPLQADVAPGGGVDVLFGFNSLNVMQTAFNEVSLHIDHGQIPLNQGPFFWQPASHNSTLTAWPRDRIQRPAVGFFSQGGGVPEGAPGDFGMTAWDLWFGGAVIDSGLLFQNKVKSGSWDDVASPAGQGVHMITADSPPYAVGNTTGRTHVELVFDTTIPSSGPSDANPPFMTALEIVDVASGRRTNQVDPGASFMVAVEVRDETLSGSGDATGVDSVSVIYGSPSGDQTTAASETTPGRYEATFTCVAGLGDLTIVVTDVAGNTLTQDFEPALTCAAVSCGNGLVEPGEECDDGGVLENCNADCTGAFCGDGNTNVDLGEECDDAGESALCDADCTLATCFDGVVNETANEECEPALSGDVTCVDLGFGSGTLECCVNADPFGTCSFPCRWDTSGCVNDKCGDGVTDFDLGEECDDGGESATCDADCTFAFCNDGVLNTAAEDCEPTLPLPATTCADLGFDGGTLGCSPTECQFDKSSCILDSCGDSVVDPLEECQDAGPDDCCSASCQFLPRFTPCDDGNLCTVGDGCAGDENTCAGFPGVTCPDDGDPCTPDVCVPETGECASGGPAPTSVCFGPSKAKLTVVDKVDPAKDKLKWVWKASRDDLSNTWDGHRGSDPTPDDTVEYALCVYDKVGDVPSLSTVLTLPPGPNWTSAKGGVQWKYKDKLASEAGIQSLTVKGTAKGKAVLRAKGGALPMPAPASSTAFFDQSPGVLVQLVNSAGACWTSEFTAPAKKNEGDRFKDIER